MIVAVGGWRGVGATTLALALAQLWGSEGLVTWLVEADPAGGVLSGRLQLDARAVGGLERIAFPVERTPALDGFHAVAQPTGYVTVVSAPVDPFRAYACHHPRVPWVPVLHDLGDVVVVDVGRVRAATPAWDVLSIADVVVVVTSAEVAAAVSSSEWVLAGGRVSPGDPCLPDDVARLCVVDSPGGITFTRHDLQADLGSVCAGWIPWDPNAVDLLFRGGVADDRAFRRNGFLSAVRRLSVELLDPSTRPTLGVIS
jgi:hypothetical protein